MKGSSPLRALALVIAVTLAAPPLGAQPAPSAHAAELKKKGDDAIESMRYVDALGAYAEAYGLTKDPALLYNMGRAYEALGQYPDALERLELFERQASPELRARVPNLAARLADLRSKVSTLIVRSSVEGARVLLANKVLGVLPLAGPIKVNAGKAVLEVSAEGFFPYKEEIDLPAGSALTINAPLLAKSTFGTLSVDSPVVGAEVSIDEKAVGKVPAEAVLAAGPHGVVLRKRGYKTSSTSAVIVAGERRSVTIPLEGETPITGKWWFWTGAAVVVAAGVVTTVALVTERKADTGTYPPGQVSGPLLGPSVFRF